ncbi:uncharacterized protein SCODWIG_00783 [Saccharomycodes ludwigii]|uniref:SAM-dependent MTase RsmB/NOP-type domain-containing protein n=1 Tax=Saccharomycodes ludwigii TaxID=36035 RepID=A0A376B336_9ASCO|nr:uncharacterized protein SCODWIG_00783 [Saccharomycodes ludwigii]
MNLYRDATWVYEDLLNASKTTKRTSGSLQSIVLNSCKRYKLKSNPKHIFALVNSVYSYSELLNYMYTRSKIDKDIPLRKKKVDGIDNVDTKNKKVKIYSEITLKLLIHDLFLSKSKRIQMGKHPIKDFVIKHKTRLNSELVRFKIKHKISKNEDAKNINNNIDAFSDITPVRWFRLNLVKIDDIENCVSELRKKYINRVSHWEEIKDNTDIYYDEFIPNLFGVLPSSKLTSHELYKRGKIIIQDRASCFPAHILNPKHNDIIIDSCSAPGNKTTHIASYIFGDTHRPAVNEKNSDPSYQIFAFEKDAERGKTLAKMLRIAGCEKLVKINIGDFTKLATPQDYTQVTGFIVDPTCSGSGIFGRKIVDKLNKDKRDKEGEEGEEEQEQEQEQESIDSKDEIERKNRLIKLSSFQFEIVKYALSFPNAKKLVYSTCSIHPEENERVVIDLLLDKQVKKQGWKLRPRSEVIPDWPRRGLLQEFEQVFPKDEEATALAESCIRALPKKDGGIGFFAVCFERN